MSAADKLMDYKEMWIDFSQDADVMIETEDEGEISIDSWCSFDYAVNEDAKKYIHESSYSNLKQENDKLKEQLKSARDVLGFYGDMDNWSESSSHVYPAILIGEDIESRTNEKDARFTGGLKARNWLKDNP